MMRAFFTNLTAVLLFIHAVLGCCWHHAHECNRCGAEHCAAAGGFDQVAPGLCGCHECSDDDQDQPAGPCRCKFECQGVCIYLPQQKSSLDAGVSGTDFDFWTATAKPVAAGIGEAIVRDGSFEPPIVETPLRLHLLYQIMLI